MSLPRPPAGKGLGIPTSSHRRGSAPALARCRQVRRATHLEGRSRKRRTCASRVQGRLVNRVIVGKSATVARSQHQSVYRWFGCQSSQAGSSIERARVQASSLATLAAEPGLGGSGNGGNGGRSSEWRRARRWECRSLGKDVTATAARIPGKGEPIVRRSTYTIGDSGLDAFRL